MKNANIAIIGGGLTGLTAAIRAAEQGHNVNLYEAAPQLGGRTQSFFHKPTQTWVDNGPHLLIGVYKRTIQLLK
ncbi:MAG: FAD-dependent oxidoreductase, partial [Mariprofundaceae bacterium]|nr:FAD-dependent oxidoreductase [Mariprofundaceae bacterium]